MSTRSKSRRPASRSDRVTIAFIGAIIAIILLTIVLIWKLSTLNNTPSWWSQSESNTRITEQAGIELENRITSALTRLRPTDQQSWSAAIDQDQLNSWLTHRFEDTVRSFTDDDWINQINDIRVNITPRGLTIGARFTHTHGSSILWAIVEPDIDTNNNLIIRPRKLYLGTTRIPTTIVSNHLRSNTLGNAKVDLGDGRSVHIQGIRPGEHRLEFALRTQINQ
ncbi:MAG: hypothetical protein AB8C13_00430 [Phycisphaerales bacterium]